MTSSDQTENVRITEPEHNNLTWIIVAVTITGCCCLGLGICILSALTFRTYINQNQVTVVDTPAPTCPSMPTGWKLLAEDAFQAYSDLPSYWPEDTIFSDGSAVSHWGYGADSYVLNMTTQEPAVTRIYANLKPMKDFYLEVNVLQYTGPSDIESGVIVRANVQDLSGDYFGIRKDQQFVISVYSQSKIPVDLRNGLTSISSEDYSRLVVLAEGPKLTYCINGQLVATIEDFRRSSGAIGFYVRVPDGNQWVEYGYDDFMLYSPANVNP